MELFPPELRTYFLTAVAAQRRRLFQTDANANLLLQLFRDDRAKDRYHLHAFILMPDHLHLILTPGPNISIEKAVQFIKGGFSFRLKSKMPVWEDSFKKLRMTDRATFESHQRYIHENPVRAHLCEHAEDFPFSSAAITDLIDPVPKYLRA